MMTEMACKNQCNALGWDDIKPICAGAFHRVDLKADGNTVAFEVDLYGRCNVEDWEDIRHPKYYKKE